MDQQTAAGLMKKLKELELKVSNMESSIAVNDNGVRHLLWRTARMEEQIALLSIERFGKDITQAYEPAEVAASSSSGAGAAGSAATAMAIDDHSDLGPVRRNAKPRDADSAPGSKNVRAKPY